MQLETIRPFNQKGCSLWGLGEVLQKPKAGPSGNMACPCHQPSLQGSVRINSKCPCGECRARQDEQPPYTLTPPHPLTPTTHAPHIHMYLQAHTLTCCHACTNPLSYILIHSLLFSHTSHNTQEQQGDVLGLGSAVGERWSWEGTS